MWPRRPHGPARRNQLRSERVIPSAAAGGGGVTCISRASDRLVRPGVRAHVLPLDGARGTVTAGAGGRGHTELPHRRTTARLVHSVQ